MRELGECGTPRAMRLFTVPTGTSSAAAISAVQIADIAHDERDPELLGHSAQGVVDEHPVAHPIEPALAVGVGGRGVVVTGQIVPGRRRPVSAGVVGGGVRRGSLVAIR
ncbi:MAG: hypothetical protein R2713_12845 [Ilumatobacteraceae bacterium]